MSKCIRRESDATPPCAEQCQGCSFMESIGAPLATKIREDLVAELRKAAAQIAKAGHTGWGNLCAEAADTLEKTLRSPLYVPREPSGMQMMMVGEATGTARDSVIEECAAVAEGWMRDMNQKSHGAAIGASIRALKGGISPEGKS